MLPVHRPAPRCTSVLQLGSKRKRRSGLQNRLGLQLSRNKLVSNTTEEQPRAKLAFQRTVTKPRLFWQDWPPWIPHSRLLGLVGLAEQVKAQAGLLSLSKTLGVARWQNDLLMETTCTIQSQLMNVTQDRGFVPHSPNHNASVYANSWGNTTARTPTRASQSSPAAK